MAKRYEFRETGTQPLYDQHYNHQRLASHILRGENTFGSNISDLSGCRTALAMLTGNSGVTNPGYYASENTWKIAVIPSLELDEKIIQLDWINRQRMVVNSGKRPIADTLDNMPANLKEKLLKNFACQDVVAEEVTWLLKKIEELSATTTKAKTEFLKFGPKGNCKANAAGIIYILDGQTVSLVNGIPTITEPTSPYLNLCCADYFDFLLPAWHRRCKEIEADHLKHEIAEARESGNPVPKFSSYSSVGRVVSRKSLPPWPDNVKPNLPKAEVVAEEIKRTKKK
ncbi:MAG: hypothetical protein D4R64_04245 [Porphyromonadaceae bacterium]|nr:MAG: hypothetical protein D4R64_04245 [Porphyromonadaceae bacterium]